MIDVLYGFLNKIGFTDPLHAPLTHIPIGLVTGAFIFFLLGIIFKKKQLVLSARHASILAFVFVFPTILFGVFDWMHFYRGILMPAIVAKMILAGSVLVFLGAGIILGSEIKLRTFWMAAIYALSFFTVAALGYFGGSLVYGKGVSATAAESTLNAAGQELFASKCQFCHAGGGNTIIASLPVKGSKRLSSLEMFRSFLRVPTMPDGSTGTMPGFRPSEISDAQVKDLYDYVSTAWK